MLRPLTTSGGPLTNLFYLWNIYAGVDLRYSDANDLVTHSTGRLMLLEIVLNCLALAMNASRKYSRHGLLLAFTSSAFVFWKTALYLALYVDVPEGNADYLAPNTPTMKLFLVFWLMNSIWMVLPLAVMIKLWNPIVVGAGTSTLSSASSGNNSGNKAEREKEEEKKALIAINLPLKHDGGLIAVDENSSNSDSQQNVSISMNA